MQRCENGGMASARKSKKTPEATPTVVTADVPAVVNPMDEFASAISRVEDEVEAQFPAELMRVLKKIAYEVGVVGLTEAEACMISDYPHATFIALKQQYPIVARLMEVKDLEYKRNLLKSISARAGTDDKVAMWLLEAKYPSEFNRRKGSSKGDGDNGEDMVGLALEFVRKSGDAGGLIREESGRAFIIKGKDGKAATLKSINEVLA